jgi:hypothetical protein
MFNLLNKESIDKIFNLCAQVQALIESSASEKGIKDFGDIEHGLCKLEDMVVLMLQNTP